VLELYNDSELATTLGYKGRNFALEKFSFEQAIEHYEDLFCDLVGKRRPSLDKINNLTQEKSVVDVSK
jgi:colanic acid biosynthesis glycosyl transferase WcaI